VIQLSTEEDPSLLPEVQLVGYQVVREAMVNSLKHAAASRIKVSLRSSDGHFVALVEDDGCGFDPQHVDESQHFGLGLMRTRTELAGGRIEVDSQPTQGTRVTIILPGAKTLQP
jgi:signal transduction histidine kinase